MHKWSSHTASFTDFFFFFFLSRSMNFRFIDIQLNNSGSVLFRVKVHTLIKNAIFPSGIMQKQIKKYLKTMQQIPNI